MVCCLLSEWCVSTSFYQRSANHVSSIFAKLILHYPHTSHASKSINGRYCYPHVIIFLRPRSYSIKIQATKERGHKKEKGPVFKTRALPLYRLWCYTPVLGFDFCVGAGTGAGVLPVPRPCMPPFHCAVNTVSAMMPHTSPAL